MLFVKLLGKWIGGVGGRLNVIVMENGGGAKLMIYTVE